MDRRHITKFSIFTDFSNHKWLPFSWKSVFFFKKKINLHFLISIDFQNTNILYGPEKTPYLDTCHAANINQSIKKTIWCERLSRLMIEKSKYYFVTSTKSLSTVHSLFLWTETKWKSLREVVLFYSVQKSYWRWNGKPQKDGNEAFIEF